MIKIRDNRGVTLVELMITLAIFSIVTAAVYSVYTTFLRHVTVERKVTKSELDVITVAWPLIKEIQSAGFGTPSFSCSSSNQCQCAISVSGNALIIHSTAAGDGKDAGKWSYIGTDCITSNIPDGPVVVIDAVSRNRKGSGSISAGNVSPCNPSTIAYWVPSTSLECYETSYALRPYNPASTRPAMCTSNTQKLSRSVSTTAGTTNYQPLLDCVFSGSLNFRFGCIDSTGNLTWQTATDCGTAKLRFVKLGLLLQSSPRRDVQGPSTVTLFEDLDSSLRVIINLTSEERYYKWKKVEQTISLRNLE